MLSSLSSSVDVVKNVINKVTRSRVQHRSSAALALTVQEHISSLCHKRVPVCLDVFVSCGCTASSQELFHTSPNKNDSDYNRKEIGSMHVERWTCTFLNRRTSEGTVTDYELLSTINDCLQKSQFSNWFRSHKGKKSYYIHYRLGAPDEVSDMSTTDVSFAQVFPVVHLDRNTCLQTAMASFFDPSSSLSIGCKFCCTSGMLDQLRLLSAEHDNNTANNCSNTEYAGFAQLEVGEPPQKTVLLDACAGAFTGGSTSNCSSRSESPATCLLPFSSLAFPLISGSPDKETQRLPTVVLGCGYSTSQPRPLADADIQTFLTEVRQQPLDDFQTALIDSPVNVQKLSFTKTVQTLAFSNKCPDEATSAREQNSTRATPVRVCSLTTTFAARPSPLVESRSTANGSATNVIGRSLPCATSSARFFNPSTGLPLHSSPAPLKRGGVRHFNFDPQLTTPRRIRSSVSGGELSIATEHGGTKILSPSAPSSPLLGSFEESILNGRIMPVGAVDGFKADLAASGAFCSPHVTLPVGAYFFQLDEAAHPWASPYLGVVNLRKMGVTNSVSTAISATTTRSRYYIPPKGTVQVTLFNPNRTVLKMFVLLYDLTDMPPSCTSFIRQRTLYMPVNSQNSNNNNSECSSSYPASAGYNNASVPTLISSSRPGTNSWSNKGTGPSFLRYLIHLRVATSSRGRLFLHSDVRLIFASDRFEFDSRIATYEMRSFTEMPCNPKFSPRK